MSSAYFGISSSLRCAAPRSSVIDSMPRCAASSTVPPGRLVDAARLHADEAVLDEVEPADAVPPAELVEPGEQRGGRQRLAVDADRVAPLEADLDVFRRVRRLLRVGGALVDVGRRLLGRVLEHLALGGGVQEVRVDREGRLAALVPGDRDLVLLGELEELGARGQVPLAPRGDDPDRRVRARRRRARSGPGRCPCRWRRGRWRRRRSPRRSRPGAWRSAAGRSRCRAGRGPRSRRWRGTSGRRSRGRTPRAGPR